MPKQLLLTSFDTWETHQRSNASDDLIAAMIQQAQFDKAAATIKLLRKLPVDFQRAPQQVIAKIDALQPDIIICCGMAESRDVLTLESNGKHAGEIVRTAIDLDLLIENLIITSISHDAGTFVCNHLYYSILKHIQYHQLDCQCLFVHVPILNETNLASLLNDFLTILQRLSSLDVSRQT